MLNIKKIFTQKGFTLIETILVFSTLAIIGAVASGFYINYSKSVQINTTSQVIAEDLKQMQSKSMSGDSGLKWGIRFINGDSQYYELFSTPTDYSDVSKTTISTNYLPIGVSFSDPSSSSHTDVIFDKITGATSVSSVTITSNGVNQTINIAALGTVSIGSSYGNTITTTSYNIVASTGSNGTISPAGTTSVSSGEDQVYTISPSTGYQVSTLIVDGASVTPSTSYTFSNVSKPHTISATFSVLTYAIVASQSSNGTISPSGTTTKNYGTSQAYTITPDTGYYVSALTIDGGSVTPDTSYTFSNIQANHTITATFSIYTYNIVATQGSNGTISPSGTTTKNYGTSQAYTITPNSCYSRSSVTVDGSTVGGAPSSYTFSNIQASHTITAAFSINTYAITVTQGSNGTISPGTTTVNCGSNQTFTITPSSGYGITSVTVDGVNQGSISSYTFSNVQTTHTITASFSRLCSGTLSNGYCWYAASQGANCSTTCSSHGGCVNASLTYTKETQICSALWSAQIAAVSGSNAPRYDGSAWCYVQGNPATPDDPLTEDSCYSSSQWHYNACSCSQ